MDTWATTDDVRNHWSDAPLDEDVLLQLLEAAHEQCALYAPALGTDESDQPLPVPVRYVLAESMQTRALGQALERDGDVLGFGDGFAIRARPLTGDVKALLRPRRVNRGPR